MANDKAMAFKAQYQSAADAAGKELGVAPDVLLAQWAQETGWGKSVIPGTNNLGNIKDFSGKGVSATDNMMGSRDKYRAYDSTEAFAKDFVGLILRKYPKAAGTGDNAAAFAQALKAGGYAEDANYASKIANIHASLTGGPVSTAPAGASDGSVDSVQPASVQTEEASYRARPSGVPAASAETERASWNDLPADAYGNAVIPKVGKEYFTALEKSAIIKAQASAVSTGATPAQVVAVGTEAKAVAPALVATHTGMDGERNDLDLSQHSAVQQLKELTTKQEVKEELAQTVGFGTKVGAYLTEKGATADIYHYFQRQNIRPEPGFQPFQNWEQELAGYNEEDQYKITQATSKDQRDLIKQQIADEHLADQALASGSTASSLGAQLVGGFADPATLGVFMGVGKVAQLAGYGAAALAAAGRPVAAVLASGAEAAAGGMLLDATLQAVGEHRTIGDYAASAGLNFGMGMGFGLLHMKPAMIAKANNIIAESVDNIAMNEKALWLQAQDNVGSQASPAQVAAEVDRIQVAEMNDAVSIALSPVPDSRRLLPAEIPDIRVKAREGADVSVSDGSIAPTVDSAKVAAADARKADNDRIIAQVTKDLGPDATPQAIAEAANAQKMAERAAIQEPIDALMRAREAKAGTSNISDPVERYAATLMYEGADNILKNVTVDASRFSKLTEALHMESTGQTLLNSKNPLAQALGVILTESSSGAAGRGQTVALTRHLMHRQFIGDFHTRYETAYRMWSREQGGSAWDDHTKAVFYGRFNREVSELIEARERAKGPLEKAYHPAVEAAADAQFQGMTRMRQAMQKVGTTGAARLGDSSFGYMSRVIRADKVRTLTEAQKAAVIDIYAKQLRELNGYDKAFALDHARTVMDIHNRRGLGDVDMPLSIHDERMSGILFDSMKAMNLPETQIKDLMGKFSRGGASFTKGRAELSLNTPYEIAGEKFTLMDIVDTDVPRLYRAYANRAAGEVALTQFGIQGRAGLQVIRTALAHGPDGKKVDQRTMDAFDQVAAELLGTPFGNRNKWIDAATTTTSILKLGGMGITQAAETFNALSSLGLARTLATIPAMPRLIREATMQAKGGGPKNPIIGSIERVSGEIGMEHHRMASTFAQTDQIAKNAGMEYYTTTERILKSGVNIQAKLSFHQAIMTGQVRGMAEEITRRAVRFIRDGGEDAALKDMGFTEEVLKGLKADLPRIAKFDQKGYLMDLDITKAKNLTAAKEFADAVNRGANQIIQGTYIGETGKWAHSSFTKFLLQFRTFGLISVEKQFNRQAGVHGAAKALGYMLAAMSFAIPVAAARTYAATLGMSRTKADEYRDKNLSMFSLTRASMNYVSMLGLAPDMFEAFSGALGLDAMDTTRGLSGNIGRIVPGLGVANDVISVGKGVSTWSPLSTKEAANPHEVFKKVSPFGRLPYLIPLVNSLGAD